MENLVERRNGKTFLKVEDADATPTEFVDMPQRLSAVDPVQICRTCAHSGNRMWHLSHEDRVSAALADDSKQFECRIDSDFVALKVTSEGAIFDSWEKRPVDPITERPVGTVVAVVNSCGWLSQSKCGTCQRFEPVNTFVERELWPGGPTRPRAVTVGGNCTIPPEGITINGKNFTCAYKRRVRNVTPMCLNCEFNMGVHKSWMVDEFHRDVSKTHMDPWEHWKALQSANAASSDDSMSDGGFGPSRGWIINQHTIKATTKHEGVWRWFAANLVEVKLRDGSILPANQAMGTSTSEMSALHVRWSSGVEVWHPVGWHDETEPVALPVWGKFADQHRAFVRFYGLDYLQYGINGAAVRPNFVYPRDSESLMAFNYDEWICGHGQSYHLAVKTAHRNFEDIPFAEGFYDTNCSVCVRSVTSLRPPREENLERISSDCKFCTVLGPCYAHDRGLHYSLETDSYEFTSASTTTMPSSGVHLEAYGNTYRLVNDEGEPATPAQIITAYSGLARALDTSYGIELRSVRMPPGNMVDKAIRDLNELQPYIRDLEDEADCGSPHKDAIEKAIKRLERRVLGAQAWTRKQDDAKRRRDAITAEYEKKAKALIRIFTKTKYTLPFKARRFAPYEVGYGAPMPLEFFKNYCALSLPRTLHGVKVNEAGKKVTHTRHIAQGLRGIDFRAVMGDSFGLMRGTEWDVRSNRRHTEDSSDYKAGNFGAPRRGDLVDNHFTRQIEPWAERMSQEEWIRGTNPLERLQEELLINEALVYTQRAAADPIEVTEPVEWHVTRLDMGVSETPDGETTWSASGSPIEDWIAYTPEADRKAYLDYMDEYCNIKLFHSDTGEDDADTTREDVTTQWTNRYRIHGYENYRGAATRRKGEEAQIFAFNHYREQTDELTSEVIQAFVCPSCNIHLTVDEASELSYDLNGDPQASNLECPDCNQPLIWIETAAEERVSVSLSVLPDIPKGQRRGIGMAIAPDSEHYNTQTRLTQLCCDGWMLRGSAGRGTPTTLKTLERTQGRV